MNKKTHIILVLLLLTLLVVAVFLNVQQNVSYKDNSYSVLLNTGNFKNEKNEFARKSGTKNAYENFKPYKSTYKSARNSSLNLSGNNQFNLISPLNDKKDIHSRSSSQNVFDVPGNTGFEIGISSKKGSGLNRSNENNIVGVGSWGHPNKGGGTSMANSNVGFGTVATNVFLDQTSPFSASPFSEDTHLAPDPGGDPNPVEMIPVPDGLGFLSLLGLFYALWKIYLIKAK